MAIENVGPGGVGNNYGVRETVARERYDLTKEYIEEYTDVEGTVVTSPLGTGITSIVKIGQGDYDALASPDGNTLYLINGA